jgi:hypothetical protein
VLREPSMGLMSRPSHISNGLARCSIRAISSFTPHSRRLLATGVHGSLVGGLRSEMRLVAMDDWGRNHLPWRLHKLTLGATGLTMGRYGGSFQKPADTGRDAPAPRD